jgi:DNA-binding NtrC family response regulator
MATPETISAISGVRSTYVAETNQLAAGFLTMVSPIVHVLSVSAAPDDHSELRQILNDPLWDIYAAANSADAKEHLTWNRVAVTICDSNVPGGGWIELFHRADEYSEPLTLIVTSTDVNKYMREDVLHLGGYDLLAKPFDWCEVRRVLTLAAHCHLRRIDLHRSGRSPETFGQRNGGHPDCPRWRHARSAAQ